MNFAILYFTHGSSHSFPVFVKNNSCNPVSNALVELKLSAWTINRSIIYVATTEGPEIKLPTSSGSWKKQESSRKTSISALLTMLKPLTVWITINCGKFFKRWESQTT